jgi:hypothetical protein
MTNAIQQSPRTRAENSRLAAMAVQNLHPDDLPALMGSLCKKFGVIRVESALYQEKNRERA